MWRHWNPKGARITDIRSLKDGMSVQARRYDKRKIYSGFVKVKVEYRGTSYETQSIWIFDRDSDQNFYIGAIKRSPYPDHSDFKYYQIYKLNRFKEKTSMSNKLMALVKLNRNQRKLSKVGIYDENGNLTEDGQEVLLNLIAKEYEDKLIELAKDWKDSKKKKNCEEDDD